MPAAAAAYASVLAHVLLNIFRRGGYVSARDPIARKARPSKGITMAAENLQELFVEELRDVYDAEKQITKALPKMAKAVESDELRAAFEEHLDITRMQINRLEEVFKSLGLAARGKTCDGMKGLLEEGQSHMEELEGSTLDAALIGAAQRVEHYEMAAYGTLATWADLLGYQDAKDLLGQTLEEEKEADEKLTGIAGQINPEAEVEAGSNENEQQNGGMAMVGSRSTRSGRGRSSGGSRGKKR
jgi:ferritin-like metal-binding protein YciE